MITPEETTVVVVECRGEVPEEWTAHERIVGLVDKFQRRGTSRAQFYCVAGMAGVADPTHKIERIGDSYHVTVFGPPWLQSDEMTEVNEADTGETPEAER